jgi:hypothetical protein
MSNPKTPRNLGISIYELLCDKYNITLSAGTFDRRMAKMKHDWDMPKSTSDNRALLWVPPSAIVDYILIGR